MTFFEILNEILPILAGIVDSIIVVFSYVWWIVLPVILFFVFWEYRLKYISAEYNKSVKWTMFELRIPKENLKSAKSMEQVFAAIHAMHTFGIKGPDKYFKGKTEPRMSFEIVGRDGGVYFFIKTPTEFKNLVESAVFAQFPDAELAVVDDYMDNYPAVVPNEIYDLWGTDITLAKDEPYPIRNYQYFEERDKFTRIDPLAAITETMSRVTGSQMIFLQFLIKATSPAVSDYKKKGQGVVDKLLGREAKAAAKPAGVFSGLGAFFKNLVLAPIKAPEWSAGEAKKDDKPAKNFAALSAGEREVVEGIEGKISKNCFDVLIRFVLFGRKAELDRSFISAIMGAFRQYNIEHMNSFRPNVETLTGQAGWIANFVPSYKKHKEYLKKRAMWDRYRLRIIAPKTTVMSVEELATIYHVPSAYVGTPKLRMLEAKKGEPPEGLPIVE